MKENSYLVGGLILVVLVGLFIVAYSRPITIYNTPDEVRKVTVSADAELDVAPDQAEIWIAINTQRATSQAAQNDNKVASTNVINALKAKGLSDNEIESTGYNLYPRDEWNPQTGEYVNKGYEVQHTLKVTTTNLEVVGSLLDAAVSAGANRINNIQFSLSKDKEDEVKASILKAASDKARSKAEALAKNLGASLGEVLSATESSYGYTPYYYGGLEAAAMDSKGEAAFPTPINPEDVTVTVSVNVVYGLK